MLSAEQKDTFRTKLSQRKQELQELIEHMGHEALGESMRDSIQELSLIDNHPADVASEVFERSKDLAMRETYEIELNNVNHALSRLEAGQYGVCSHCGKEIPTARLETVPEADLCVDCKELANPPDRTLRPVEEFVVKPPWNEMNNYEKLGRSEKADSQYDGEDTWQEVAMYGSSDGAQSVPNNIEYNHNYPDWDEDVGAVEDVDQIPYTRGEDGVIYGVAIEDDNEFEQI